MKTMVNHFVISIEFLKILCNPYPLLPLDGAQLLANRSLIRGNVGSYPKQISLGRLILPTLQGLRIHGSTSIHHF